MLSTPPTLDANRLFLLSEKHKSFLESGTGKLYEFPLWMQIFMWLIPIAGFIWTLQISITFLNDHSLYEEFRRTGVTSSAQVISHRIDNGAHTHYYITYQFRGTGNNQTSQLYSKEEA